AAVVSRRVERGAVVKGRRPTIEQCLADVVPIGLLYMPNLEWRHVVETDYPDSDELHLTFLEVIAVIEPMLLMEASGDVGHIDLRHRPVRELGPQLKTLAVIAAFCEPLEFLTLPRNTVFLKIAPHPRRQLVDERIDPLDRGAVGMIERDDQR